VKFKHKRENSICGIERLAFAHLTQRSVAQAKTERAATAKTAYDSIQLRKS